MRSTSEQRIRVIELRTKYPALPYAAIAARVGVSMEIVRNVFREARKAQEVMKPSPKGD